MKYICVFLLFSAFACGSKAATVVSVTISSSSTSLRKGDTATLSCEAVYSTGARASCVSPIYSEDQSGTVVRISGPTMIAYSVGAVTITGTAAGVSGSLAVSVAPPLREPLGTITAAQAVSGLGFNVNPANDWEFQDAALAGATHVRFQCGWSTLELQTPPPANAAQTTRYALQPYCVSGYASARKYNLHPTVLAAYGAPYHPILNVAVPSGAPAGATSLNVQFVSGQGGDTLASLAPFYDTMIRSDGTQIGTVHSYPGVLITAITLTDQDHATVTLASGLAAALPADLTTQYTLNEYLYPPPATSSFDDSSVQRYTEYAEFLASSIASAGLSGEVELWNEPTWPDDRWDERANAYDVFPGASVPGPAYAFLPNWGFVGALQNHQAPSGVQYIWGGTEKTGANSALDPQMQRNSGVAFLEPALSVSSESFHPYGNSPEDGLWIAPCWSTTNGNNDFFSCNLFGVAGGNFSLAAQEDFLLKQKNPAYGIAHNITETGFSLGAGDAAHQARFIMRQFLGFQAAGVTPVEFYRLYDTGPEQLGFLDPVTRNPLPSYVAIAGLISDLASIEGPVITASSEATLASVQSYGGAFPLDSVHLVGSRAGDTSNSEMFVVWQRSYTVNGAAWATLAQPEGASVTVSIPQGMKVARLMNLDTRQTVSYKATAQEISFSVSDDPIALTLIPR